MARLFVLALCALAVSGAFAQPSPWPKSSNCKGSIQDNLRYTCSDAKFPDTLPSPVEGETLADAVCCDENYRAFAAAEPQFFFQQVDLFKNMKFDKNGEATFYDSVCGKPLFTVPRNRTLEEWQAETTKHGWPSFRIAEVHTENVILTAQGEVKSVCGTHLGHDLPDEEGHRYCLDLVCLAGNPESEVAAPVVDADGYGVDLATFDGASSTTFKWKDLNDPVMGGLSTSTFTFDNNVAVFNGTVAIVPSLKAPGFCNAETTGIGNKFADISSYSHLMLKVRTSTPEYSGYKISFAADTLIPQFYSFKSDFNLTGTDWQYVSIPFTDFSNDWSSYTGECTTKDPTGKQHYCCSKDSRGLSPSKDSVCASSKNLKDISQLGIWVEGAAGDFHLEIERIGAGNPKTL